VTIKKAGITISRAAPRTEGKYRFNRSLKEVFKVANFSLNMGEDFMAHFSGMFLIHGITS
jgi:hypothetical protein